MIFPPTPVFPNSIDSDYTLFLVHNTTQTKICLESLPWAEEIVIIPVKENEEEIWADNGFGNISGELFYYDSVEKNSSGKVFKLKKCARNLGGKSTKYNPPGTWIKSYVVAEHHNQLVDSILKIEDFVGYNFDPREETLDWRIRNLQNLETIFDDFSCPDVFFNWLITENNPTTGIVAEYLIEIETTGATGAVTFRLDFGDGEYTSNTLSGTHRYALNSTIDPVLTLSNDKCQLITTPTIRNNPSEPEFIPETPFDSFIPEFIPVPDFIIVPVNVPEPEINIPPLVTPCISLEGQIGPIPSVITGPDINIGFSYVLIESTNPVNITQSVVTIEGGPINIPSYVFVDIPPTIVIDPPIPPTIVIVASSNIELSLNATNMPKLEIEWGETPEMNIAFTYPKRTKMVPINNEAIENFGDEFADLMFAQDQMMVEVEEVGIPEEIIIVPPTSMPKIEFDVENIPKSIKIESSEIVIPSVISIQGPEHPIPDTIVIDGSKIQNEILLNKGNIPESISLVMDTMIPSKVEIELINPIPDKILIETVTPIPSRIILEAIGIPDELKVTGIPDTIEIVGFPDFLQLKMPENPEIELVYRGSPIEMKVDLQSIITDANGQGQCFTLVPCRA